ncbi:MAG: SMI1/KNR4 family protein [Planctomycetaceae bacterium]
MPMQNDIRTELEVLCGSKLPTEYLALLETYPQVLSSALRSDDGSRDDGTVADVELLSSPGDVLTINQEVRNGMIYEPDGTEFFWPSRMLVIGETGDGDYYCLDTEREVEGVIQYRHRPVDFVHLTESLDDFVELLIEAFVNITNEDLEDFDEEEEDEEEF